MTMTLRRSDSLPTRLRVTPIPLDADTGRPREKLHDSSTVPNFSETPAREEVIATWKSLHTEVKKIKNGFTPPKDQPDRSEDKNDCASQSSVSTFACHSRDGQKRISYENRQVEVGPREKNRCTSFLLDTDQTDTIESGKNSVYRRRSLLQRLLSWRTPECDCRERFTPKYQPTPRLHPEDLLCTCGVSGNRIKPPKKCKKNPERGRSKSVGYEAAREVAQFRRLVQCV